MKKKVGNRLIALLLALFMVVTMMPDMGFGQKRLIMGWLMKYRSVVMSSQRPSMSENLMRMKQKIYQ